MIFNSLSFAGFLGISFLLYWLVFHKKIRTKNVFLLSASYVFYSCWDWRFLVLLALVTISTWCIGIKIQSSQSGKARNHWLLLGLGIALGTLGVFKYFNFFADSFFQLLRTFSVETPGITLKLLLPVGISFYTFQALGYVIDVHQRKIGAEKDLLQFATFVSFFPQLSAGPIERAGNMLPQFAQAPKFDYGLASDGMRQILWGLFKKVVVADNCGVYVNDIFANYQDLSGGELVFGAGLYAMQLYCDFSGYSDMAIGVAKLFGIRLIVNFNYPYFSQNITEFWRRWHVSLSTWFRDYLFTPLAIALRNQGTTGVVVSMLTSFLLIGLWHGANWNYIVFGGLHGLILTYELLTKKRRKKWKKAMPARLYEIGSIVLTFAVWCVTLLFFRSPSLTGALDYIGQVFSSRFIPENFRLFNQFTLLMVLAVVLLDWFFQKNEHPLRLSRIPVPLRWSVYLAMGFCVFNFIHYKQQFIYFVF